MRKRMLGEMSMANDKEYQLHTCYHCGNTGLLKVEHCCSERFGEPVWDEFGNEMDFELVEDFKWSMLSCPVCHMITLREEYTNDCYHGSEPDISTLYPVTKINYEGVPESIKSSFESAMKVKSINTQICLLALRMVLEAICKDKGAKGNTLEQMIKDMIANKVLPEMFDDACWVIRQLGNSAAHADKRVYNAHQVDQTIGFMKDIINYLYTLPQQMKSLRSAVDEERKIKDSDASEIVF